MTIARLTQRELLLFDLDGTLVDSAFDLYRAMNLSLEYLNLPQVTEEQVRTWIGKGTSLFCESTLRYVRGEVDQQLHLQLLNTVLEIYNADPCVDTRPFPGILKFLDWGLKHHKKLVCVTNKPEVPARKILDVLNMDHYFADVIGGDRFEVRKPHPRPLLYCMEHYAARPDQTLMIGDSSNDVEAARRAQIDCIVVSYGYNHGEDIRLCSPQLIVDDLTELLAEV
ncbi:HAD-IA family hydrolase [Acinetobacter sp. WZC-1]|uniref:HAD-IA family hydrolase n=1 Tax=Acinetobacter sp. WZC-1 TaxID=3459034 RepID=UPI00403D8B87